MLAQVGFVVVNFRSALKKTFGGYAHAIISTRFSVRAASRVGVSEE